MPRGRTGRAVTTAATHPPELTSSAEDYLKAIYALARSGESVATNALAQRLGVAPGSASGMVQRLAEQGLLTYERYRGVHLTQEGRSAALRTLRRHRIIESYLTTVLGYAWDRVHEEAERLEHAASGELIDRMAAALGDPVFDPHGAPIPTREGTVDETAYDTLAELEVGRRARVACVVEQGVGTSCHLGELGLRRGADVVITERTPSGGPITVDVGGEARLIGPAPPPQALVTAPGR